MRPDAGAAPLFRLTAAVLACMVSGCSNLNRLDIPIDRYDNRPTVKSIVQRVRCELAAMAADNYKYKAYIDAGDFVVAVQLSLTVNDDGSLAPTFVYTNGLFSFNAGARLEASREQNFTERLFFSIAGIRKQIALDGNLACPAVDTALAGDLGIVPSAEMALTGGGLDLNAKLEKTDGAFGGYVTFVMTKNLNAVGPTYTLTHFKGPGSLAGVSEINTDKITFAFARRSAKGKVPEATSKATASALVDSIQIGEIPTTLRTLRGQ